jgi:hypothetical protein
MSIEADFRATLVAHAPLTALVPAARIAQNAVDSGGTSPAVVFIATHAPILGLDSTQLGDQCQLEVQCWAESAVAADAVADAVKAAVATAPAAACAVVTSRASTFDPETGQDGTVLSVEWWV